jgi:hypothetical protein
VLVANAMPYISRYDRAPLQKERLNSVRSASKAKLRGSRSPAKRNRNWHSHTLG